MDLENVYKAIQNLSLNELRRAYRKTFEIAALEPVRGLIAYRLEAMGVKLPKIETHKKVA